MTLELATRIINLFNEKENWDALSALYLETHGAKPTHGVLSAWLDRAQKMVDNNKAFCAQELERYRESVDAAAMTPESDWDPEYEAQADARERAAWKKHSDAAVRAAEKPHVDAWYRKHGY